MIDGKIIDEIAEDLAAGVPAGVNSPDYMRAQARAAVAELANTLDFGREARRWCALAGESRAAAERAYYEMLSDVFAEPRPRDENAA